MFSSVDIITTFESFGKVISSLFAAFPDSLRSVVQSLSLALGLALVFLFGLLLDLFSSYLLMCELTKFKKHLEYNHPWLSDLVKRHEVYIGDDYDRIIIQVGNVWSWDEFWRGIKLSFTWKPTVIKEEWKKTC